MASLSMPFFRAQPSRQVRCDSYIVCSGRCCLQLVAGEEIDATLGVKLGFSTLASAGLGNLVSDVAGIGFADQLEVRLGNSRTA